MKHFISVLFLLSLHSLWAQPSKKNWYLLDPQKDSVQGISLDNAYQFLANQKAQPIIVAVIDSGVDIEHEDLKPVIWTNPLEIAGNGVDDDKNGYVDDVHGWNFIGGKNGNVSDDTIELTREYARLSSLYKNVNEATVSKKKKAEYDYYKKIESEFESKKKYNQNQLRMVAGMYKQYKAGLDSAAKLASPNPVTKDFLRSLQTESPTILFTKMIVLDARNEDTSIEDITKDFQEAQDHFQTATKSYDPQFNPRTIVGDNYANLKERYYGNTDVKGPDADHGTHVAGIIGAVRNNNMGIDGICANVRIMPVRAVPNGDERDKDVANAIRYAVDNGAKIINMSFGKDYSPQKEAVDEAVRYAEKKNVLLIHAAGNDGQDNDVQNNFPTPQFLNGKKATNWIEVGASGMETSDLAASFSNFGQKSVTLFSPGVKIYSTIPNNKYTYHDGTSMASPVTTGVAALVWSYFPQLTANQVKDVLTRSVRTFGDLTVPQPGSQTEVKFSSLSSTGGIVNAYQAVKLAAEYAKQVTPK